MNADTATISDLPLFGLLSDDERGTLSTLFSTVSVRRGERVFNQGDLGASLYVVRVGRVRIAMEGRDGQQIILSENGPGAVFGEVSLLDGGPRTAEVVALADTELLTLDRDDLLEFITKHPPAALSLLTVMGRRLRSTNDLLLAQSSRNVNDVHREGKSSASLAAESFVGSLGTWVFLLAALAVSGFGLAASLSPTLRPARDVWVAAALGLILVEAAALFMARRLQSEKDRIKADLDYQFNLKAELEFAKLSRKLETVADDLGARLTGIEMDKALSTPSAAGLAPSAAARTGGV